MIRKTIILMSFALCVLGDGHHAVSEQHIKINHKEHHGHHGELTHVGNKKPEHHEEYAWSYPSYEFSYSVDDPHTHDKKSQHESREGDEVKGEYWLIEPDGRKRTVTYHADKHSGFHAIVHYSDHHHHITEHYGYGKDDQKDDDEKPGDEENSGESGQGEEEKNDDQKGDDEGSNNEEDSGDKWGYNPKWVDKKWDDKKWDDKKWDDKNRDDKKWEKKERDDKREDEGRSDEERDREESLLYEERRKFDERRGYPSNIALNYGRPSRINPRFNMYNLAQLRTDNRY